MEIKVDQREKKLISELKILNNSDHVKNKFEISISNLPLGDIIICDQGKELLVIERKTYQDLASSIRDGRYIEQSYRLDAYPIHNHNIIYLIEGDIKDARVTLRYVKMEAKTLQTTLFSILYFKGFSVYQTKSVMDTASWVLKISDKIKRENGKRLSYYDPYNKHMTEKYNTVIHKIKKDNILPENMAEIVLSQVPMISHKTANIIMNNFSSISDLLNSLKENDNCLDKIIYKTDKGKTRHISKTCISNIKKFLLYSKA